jgi:hypothetical protein
MTVLSSSKLPFSSSKLLTIIATILGIPFLAFYWMALIRLVPDVIAVDNPNWSMPLSIALYLPFAFVAYIIFGNAYAYIVTTIAGIAVAIAGLIRGQCNKSVRVWLLSIICAIVAFPLVYHYHPALVAASGYRMNLVTQPGFLGGIVKESQNLTEQTPCEYELLGWSTDNQLYYRATCDGESQVWQYSPNRPSSHTQVSSNPASLSTLTISDNTVLEMVRAGYVKPRKHEPAVRRLHLKSKGMVSPDGDWIAIIARHIYGTQDVIVLADAK